MKKIVLLFFLTFLYFNVLAQKVEVGKDNVVKVDGNPLFKVKKTKNLDLLTEEMVEFTIYDLKDVPHLKFEGKYGRIMFLDDNQSFLPRVCDAWPKSVAKFVASDSIFTEKGYNYAYKKDLILKHKGYLHTDREKKYTPEGLLIRDKSTPPYFINDDILQDGMIIGSSTMRTYSIDYKNDKNEIICTEVIMDKPVNNVWEVILDFPKNKTEKTLKIYNYGLIKTHVLTHLYDNNYL